jgi:hypothetical protein
VPKPGKFKLADVAAVTPAEAAAPASEAQGGA